MKRLKKLFPLAIILLLGVGLSTSCNKKTGCKINESAHVSPNKKGNYKKSKTRSGLFPKDMNRKKKSK